MAYDNSRQEDQDPYGWNTDAGSMPYQDNSNPSQPAADSTTGTDNTSPWAPFYYQKAGIAAAYKKYLGRDIKESVPGLQEGEYQYWLGNQDYENGIKNSGEAQAYAASQAGNNSGGGGSQSGGSSGGGSSTSQSVPVNPNQVVQSANTIYQGSFQPGISGGIVPNPQGVSQDLIDQLMNRAKQSLAIDPTTDPIIHPQVDAAAATQERSRRNYLNDLAESSNPYSTGALNTAGTQTAEAAGQNVSALQSQLVQNELGSRRQEIAGALNSMAGLLTADQQLSLQRQLDSVNAALAQQQLSQSNNQWLGDLAYRYAALGSQNDQFANTFGLNLANQANYWDWIRSGGKF